MLLGSVFLVVAVDDVVVDNDVVVDDDVVDDVATVCYCCWKRLMLSACIPPSMEDCAVYSSIVEEQLSTITVIIVAVTPLPWHYCRE